MSTIVFLGPSLPLADAKRLLEAEFRPPIRRGDLEDMTSGAVVGMIDGVFEQSRSVSPREIREALARGVHIVGGGSMGALRAAEVPGVQGVGLIHEWYRRGLISRDDEVALVYDQDRNVALSVPLVNVRFAVERLCRPGTLNRELGQRLIAAASELPYEARTYRAILRRAGMADRRDSADLIGMLQASDLKREDAQVVLETIGRLLEERSKALRSHNVEARAAHPTVLDSAADPVMGDDNIGNPILIWESGDRVTMSELIEFLGFTGTLERYARNVVAHFPMKSNAVGVEGASSSDAAQAVLNGAAKRWGWLSPEEGRVTLADLGVTLASLSKRCLDNSIATAVVRKAVADRSNGFEDVLRAGMYLDDMALKREAMRLGAFRYFANIGAEYDPTSKDLAVARQVLCKLNDELEFSALRRRWLALGLGEEEAQDRFILQLARARSVGRDLAARMCGVATNPAQESGDGVRLKLGSSPKAPGESRFSLPIGEAFEHASRLRDVIGITRVGMIGELSEVGGIQIAQAARPDNAWSSTYGSGKSLTKEGAIVGSIMEETEKWAQEQFKPSEAQLCVGSFEELSRDRAVVDPRTLDLPYDTPYQPDQQLTWYDAFDLMTARNMWVPLDFLRMARSMHDICYTRRGARKVLATNGLGSGFTRAEAILHAMCEYVERHALRLADLFISNPGGLTAPPYRFVDLSDSSDRIRLLGNRVSRGGATVRVLDVTSDIRIPTFFVTIVRDLQRADGYAAHPDPECALEMALLEAAQTICSFAAGGREDLSIRARSLGRHERPRPIHTGDAWFWLDPDPRYKKLQDVVGFSSRDIADEVTWCLDRIRKAGIEHVLVVDLTVSAIEPAHVVRVLIPDLESNNPFHTGPRARLALLRDLLPKWR